MTAKVCSGDEVKALTENSSIKCERCPVSAAKLGERRPSMGDESEFHYRLVSLGGAAVGKSSILKRFLFGTYCDRHRPTVEDLYSREFDIGDADLTENVDSRESSVCSLVHRDKVRYTSATKLSNTIWKGTTVLPNHSGLMYVIYENWSCSP
ncbi:hypothetical protein AVEN_49138-1 [Araneus ventricosus]|uniref:Uncharacterized protein n=1 Tax=Araneus ventricosus TaxID=182803 RepID=A0A4Y2BZI9_ARAVE|nr:hypothetical protein AVEN_49138-1 [Araneus ventricosus]